MIVSRRSLALLTLVAFGVTCGPALREDEIHCEEATEHLKRCCPGFEPPEPDWCNYSAGCGEWVPALTTEQSECIQARDCKTLVEQGICDRAAKAKTRNLEDPEAGPAAEVCP